MVAPAGRAAARAPQGCERLGGRDRLAALAALAEELLRFQVEARERAAGLLARLLGGRISTAGRASRDVEEAPLLLERASSARDLVGVRLPEGRAVEERVLRARERREPALDEVADEDRVPLEPLRLVHGEERDGIRRRRRGQPVLELELSSRNDRGNSAGVPSNSFAASESAVTAASSSISSRVAAGDSSAEVLEPLPEGVDRGARGCAGA